MSVETIEDIFLEIIEGTITDFHYARGTVNLLDQLQKNSKAKNTAAGVAAAAAGLHGIVASSAMLVMYDGENVENFICRIDDKVVCGQFSGADRLKNGDKVKAVVTKKDELIVAEAIMRSRDEVLWLPVGSYMGTGADFREQIRTVKWGSAISYVILFILGYFIFTSGNLNAGLIIMFLAIPPTLLFFVALWVHSDTRKLALRSEDIFKVFGFPYPEDINMSEAMYFLFKPVGDSSLGSQTMSMFYYQKAIEFEKQRRLKKKLPLHDSTTLL